MPEVRNRSGVPHRYYDYARKAYVIWAPGEVKDVPHAVAHHVCQAHPGKMELVVPTPEPIEVPAEVAEEVSEAFTEKAVDRAQRGGSRRSASSEEA